MSTDLSIRPATSPAAIPIHSSVSRPADDAIATQLPPAQTVGAASAPAFADNNPQDGSARQVVLDRAAASFVYQVVDERTNQVVKQFPDDAILRRRAYFRTLDLQKASASVIPTDRKV